MANVYKLQSGALGDQILLECLTTSGAPATLPTSGATFSVSFEDPLGNITTHTATLVQPNFISFTTSTAFSFTVGGTWKAQGFVNQNSQLLSKTAVVTFEVDTSLM